MDPVIFEDVANSLSKLRMYPYFDLCHFVLMSIAVKEDIPQSGSTNFSRRHPFSCWLATMLMCFGGAILSSFVCGEPLLLSFNDTRAVLTATIVWYLVNYFPFDLLYRICKFLPFRIFICSLKEIQRAKKIVIGVHHGIHQYPNSPFMCVLLGLLKGCGSVTIRPVSQFVLGVWEPWQNPFIRINFTTKISLLAAVAYYVQSRNWIPLSENLLFLSVAAVFLYLRVTMILLGLKDPFIPFENIICTVLFGGTVDALKSAFDRSRVSSTTSVSPTPSTLPTSPSFQSQSAASVHGTVGSVGTTPASANTAPTAAMNGQTGVRDSVPRQSSDKKRD
ncbi:Trimeric intracellular cation channel type B-A [Paragonimus heterotremus]|uniref:Trimeric intracellular cation channel type B-A n=1 Tax=Paragonimus heterotremus TaxID=100268 RepID=A0A8J4T9J3_9TREM|nr:Trimeric intracellular cation channel type B-A [Paragonimus heterotremus]